MYADREYFRTKDVPIIAISGDRAAKLAEKMCKYELTLVSDLPKHDIALTYKSFLYQEIFVDNFTRKVKLNSPITYLINPEGKIVWKYVGTREDRPSNETLHSVIESHL